MCPETDSLQRIGRRVSRRRPNPYRSGRRGRNQSPVKGSVAEPVAAHRATGRDGKPSRGTVSGSRQHSASRGSTGKPAWSRVDCVSPQASISGMERQVPRVRGAGVQGKPLTGVGLNVPSRIPGPGSRPGWTLTDRPFPRITRRGSPSPRGTLVGPRGPL